MANVILGQLFIYESKEPVEIEGLFVDLGSFGLYYDPAYGPNWWNYYFEPLYVGNIDCNQATPLTPELFSQGFKKRRQLTRGQAAKLVKKYIRVKEPILNKVNSLADHYFGDLFTIGVHYRGTDKGSEAPLLGYEIIFKAILDHMPSQEPWQIFVATDEVHFLEAIQHEFSGRVIACETLRSKEGIGVHFLNAERYRKGEEALIDALLLSKCQLLIRTSSNLSLWSTYFNPELPTILLSQRFRSYLNAEPE